METAMRFDDDTLRSILAKMRTPGGEKLSENEWAALEPTKIENHSANPAWLQDARDFYPSCYLWSIVTKIAYLKARESATRANCPLFLIQAVDRPTKTALLEQYVAMLRIPSLSNICASDLRQLCFRRGPCKTPPEL
jgi:hypothetical protein